MSEYEYTIEKAGLHAFVYAASTIIYLIVQVVTLMVIARTLGPANYGLYGLALIPLAVLSLFTDFGIDTTVLRYSSLYASRREYCKISYIVKRALLAKLVLSSAVSIPLVFAGELLGVVFSNREGIGYYVALTSLVLVPQVLVNSISSLLIGLGRARERTILYLVQPLARLFLIIALFELFKPSVENAILATAVSYFTSLGIGLLAAWGWIADRGCWAEVDEMLAYALAIYTSGLAGAIVSRLQSYLLGLTTARIGDYGNTLVGFFNAAFNFLGAVTAVYGAIATPLVPLFVHYYAGNSERLRDIATTVMYALTVITLPISIFSILFSPEIIRTVYGASYIQSSLYYSILSLTLVFWPITTLASSIIQSLGLRKAMVYSNIILLVAGVILYPVLSLSLGIVGLSLAYVLTSIPVVVYQFHVLSSQGLKIGFANYGKIVVASLVANIIAQYASSVFAMSIIKLLIGGLVMLIAYSVLTALFKAIGDAELAFLQRVTRNIPLAGYIIELYITLYTKISRRLSRETA
ncbi:oligosaccharide flippase family protein [Thermogladius sp. 4427co]|uniref:oligosaccharide flippase family protein n=1 Tax=Thermogladius sp. 4427co TaxID=3450718 RepID=UPI003F79C915